MSQGLTKDMLVTAALSIVDEEGAEALSMRSLAARVDRRVSSLYNHISGRGELIEAVRARIVLDIDVSAFGQAPWPVALDSWARSYMRAFASHQHLIRVLATTPIRDHSTLAMYDVVVGALVTGGVPSTRAVGVMRAVEAYILGSAHDVVAPANVLDEESVPEELAALRSGLSPEALLGSSALAAFELGLPVLIRGLAQEFGAA